MRAQVAAMSGLSAKTIGDTAQKSETFQYLDEIYPVGFARHQSLMKLALRAKFAQNPDCLQLLLATGDAQIIHHPLRKDGTPYPDSTTIPAEIFSRFLMEVRDEFRKSAAEVEGETVERVSGIL